MKKILLLLLTVVFISSLNAQDNNAWLQTRVLNVDASDVEKFESAVAKKNQCIIQRMEHRDILHLES